MRAGIMGTPLPCTASHEGTGVVVALGSELTDAQEFKKGDRVMAGLPRNRCGHCPDCLGDEGYSQYCPNVGGLVGVTTDGAFAEYIVVDGRESCVIPDNVSFETAAPLACAGCTIFRGLLQTELKRGETVALVGAGGGLGHLGCQFAKAMGLVVVGIDAREEGLALAKKSGADIVVDARGEKEEVVKQVQDVTNGMGADATVTISDSQGAAALACAVTKRHGTMVQIAQVNAPTFVGESSKVYVLIDYSHPRSRSRIPNWYLEISGSKVLSSAPKRKLSVCWKWSRTTTYL